MFDFQVLYLVTEIVTLCEIPLINQSDILAITPKKLTTLET